MIMKKLLSVLCSAFIALSCVITPVWAESIRTVLTQDQSNGDDFTEIFEESETVIPEVDFDNEELFDTYLNMIFYDNITEDGDIPSTFAADNVAKNHLGETALKMYQALKDHCTKVANGEETSSKFAVDMEAYGFKSVFTAEELGVSNIISGGAITDEAKTAFRQKFADEINFNGAFKCLLADNPYIMYWFDKSIGSTFRYGYGTVRNSDGTLSLRASSMVVTLYVAPGYNADDTYLKVDPEAVNKAKEASANAHQIVAEHENESDYDKICSYKDEIMELASYDNNAADAEDFESYGTVDPWQLIWVFDGDPETNVVCEGYSKAMQYLCELSTFTSPYVECYSVTGTLGDGGHMWNIIVMDDNVPYLVDVTNMDAGTIGGVSGGAFLNGAVSGDVETGFVMPNFGETLRFTYDSTTLVTISHDVLNISKTDYVPTAQTPSITTNHVSFDWNYANSGFVEDITLTAGCETVLPENNYRRNGYYFTGWNTKMDGTGTAYSEKESVNGLISTVSENVTLFAQWTADTAYDVRFDWNYANSGSVDSIKGYQHTGFVFPENGFVKDHFVFTGWNTKMDGSGTAYNPSDVLDTVTEDMTFYAQWQEVPVHDVRFDWNYANSGSVNNILVYDGTSLTFPENGFVKDHSVFTGWNTKMDGSGAAYNPSDVLDTVTEDMIFYAQWREVPVHDVRFDWNYANSGSVNNIPVYDGTSLTFPENGFVKDHSVFTGWNTKMDGSGAAYNPSDVLDTVTEDMTFYAQWKDAASLRVVFDWNYGNSGEMNPMYVYEGTTVKVPANAFIKEKCTFAGWNTEMDGSGISVGDQQEADLYELFKGEDTILYAQWKQSY